MLQPLCSWEASDPPPGSLGRSGVGGSSDLLGSSRARRPLLQLRYCRCRVFLPANLGASAVLGPACRSKDAAKKVGRGCVSVCACVCLHVWGAC